MIRLQRSWVEAVRRASNPSDLQRFLQAALELEHATIPLYLTAEFSLRPGANKQVREVIRSVVIDEMLHFAIAANILNAVGGQPVLDSATFVPTFPGPLPMGIDDDLVLHLAPMSMAQCEAFMDLEEPEEPFVFPDHGVAAAEPDFETIGTFYEAVISKIEDLGDQAFRNPSHPQVTAASFPPTELFPVTDAASAVAALELVVRQGEGTRTSPLDPEGGMAHYYRLSQIKHGRQLVVDPTAPEGFSYSGEPLPFDPAAVWPLVTDPRSDRYPEGTAARGMVDEFNRSYTDLLKALQETFNGQPEQLDAGIGLMFDLQFQASQMVKEPDPSEGALHVTPTWEYLDRSE